MSGHIFSIREIPKAEWPPSFVLMLQPPTQVWVCDEYLVQAYADEGCVVRLTISSIRQQGRSWVDRISWDVLQGLKARVGYGDYHAVEIYPADEDLVNVANMRHLWVLPEPPAFAWRGKGRE